MQGLQLSGGYFDIGYKSGLALKELGFVPRHANSVEVRFAQECVPEIRKSFPEMLEEIEGLGFALKCNYKDVLSMVLTTPVISEDHSTVFASAGLTKSSPALLAGNYNRHYRYTGHHLRIKAGPKGAYASIGNTDMAVGRQDGMNSEGLAVSGASVSGGQIKPGMGPALLVRQALDRCASVDEAARLLSGAKHARAFNFLLADGSGKVALVEASPRAVNVKLADTGTMVATNHFQSRRMAGGSIPRDDTVSRHRRVLGLVPGKVDAEAALKVLSDHKGRVCEHLNSSEFGTVWSGAFSTRDGTYVATEGNPCTGKRKSYKV
jgi:predicted choloylglycine hydrolase